MCVNFTDTCEEGEVVFVSFTTRSLRRTLSISTHNHGANDESLSLERIMMLRLHNECMVLSLLEEEWLPSLGEVTVKLLVREPSNLLKSRSWKLRWLMMAILITYTTVRTMLLSPECLNVED